MNNRFLVVIGSGLTAASIFGCAPSGTGSNSQDNERAIQALAAQVPKKVDAATTLVEVRSDGQGGVIYVNAVDTSMVSVPSTQDLKQDRKSVVEGKSGSVRGDLGGRRINKKKIHNNNMHKRQK